MRDNFLVSTDAEVPQVPRDEPEIMLGVDPTWPEFKKFLCGLLGWRENKIQQLEPYVGIKQDVGAYLDAYSADSKGLKMHPFISSTAFCEICEHSAIHHNVFTECSVCCEFKTDICAPSTCSHQFCRQCWSENINAKLNIGAISRINCLDYSCKQPIDETFIRSVLDDTDFLKYKNFTNALLVDSKKSLIFCPNKDCGQIVDKTIVPVVCRRCRIEICNKCDLQSHPNTACLVLEDRRFRRWASRASKLGVKNCPTCRSRTEKLQGCNHMTCIRCATEWCWVCGQVIESDHYNYSLKNLIYGCPGMQFRFGKRIELYIYLVIIWMFSFPVFLIAPLITGIVMGLWLPPFYWVSMFKTPPPICNKTRKCTARLLIFIVGALSLPFIEIASFVFCIVLGIIATILLTVFVTPIIALFVPFYLFKITAISLKNRLE